MFLKYRRWILAVAVLALVPACGADQNEAAQNAARQAARAAQAFKEIMQTPDHAIPDDLLARAKAIAVFPGVVKAAFVVGGEGGRGVVSVRAAGGWGSPVFFRAAGPSVGPQIGGSSTDIVLLFMNDDALASLMRDKFQLGADVAVAGGPVGREASAGTDALMHAEILSWSRSRGLFAGVSLKGIVIRPEDQLNEAVYNRTAHELLVHNSAAVPDTEASLSSFTQALSQYSPKPQSPH